MEIKDLQSCSLSSLLAAWAYGASDPETLRVWLAGADPAFRDPGIPPYYQILQAQSDKPADHGFIRLALAQRAADLLKLKPDHEPSVLGPDGRKILFNLLWLCEGLAYPAILGEQLSRILRDRKLTGSWDRFSLAQVFCEALIRNQRSAAEHRELWTRMLNGTPVDFPPASEDNGFQGLINASDKHGVLDIENVSSALKLIANLYNGRIDRRTAFKKRTAEIIETFAFVGIKSETWLEIAKKADLPFWAGESLPPFPPIPEEGLVAVWSAALMCLPKKQYPYTVRDSICGGAALMIDPSQVARDRLREVLPPFEKNRRDLTDDDPRTKLCMVNFILIAEERKCPNIRKARRLLVDEARTRSNMNEAEFDRISREFANVLSEQFENASSADEARDTVLDAAFASDQPLENLPQDSASMRTWLDQTRESRLELASVS